MSLNPISDCEYDLIIAGGGTAACIIAGRIAAASPSLRILILEAGSHTEKVTEHTQPGRFLSHLSSPRETIQFYRSTLHTNIDDRPVVVPCGRCVGGGSAVNFMQYNRPAASDFDEWETEYDNLGWGSKNLIPLVNKAETYEIDPLNPTHGGCGPLKVSYGSDYLEIGKQFLELGPQIEPRRGRAEDGNTFGADSINVFYRMPKWISREGSRSDVAHHYIYNLKPNRNLTVADRCYVRRIIFEDARAVGVEFSHEDDLLSNRKANLRTVRARCMVVISAGTMGSPLILERSGIGSSQVLTEAGVDQVVNLPGVGENYNDHPFLIMPYIAHESTVTYDALFRDEPEELDSALEQWNGEGKGLLGSNAVDAAIKLRPYEDELAQIGPEIKDHWDKMLAGKEDRPLAWLNAFAGLSLPVPLLAKYAAQRYMAAACFLTVPATKGSIHITSSDEFSSPKFECGFLENPADIVAFRWAYKKAREIFRRLPAFRGAFKPLHPQFEENSVASLNESEPVALTAPNIIYSAEDDEAIDAYIRKSVASAAHPLGTCAMKPREQGGVVDSKLNVFGISGLKVADLSIPPSNVTSNTYSAAIAIGEKAAIIIAEEMGISLL